MKLTKQSSGKDPDLLCFNIQAITTGFILSHKSFPEIWPVSLLTYCSCYETIQSNFYSIVIYISGAGTVTNSLHHHRKYSDASCNVRAVRCTEVICTTDRRAVIEGEGRRAELCIKLYQSLAIMSPDHLGLVVSEYSAKKRTNIIDKVLRQL